MIKSQEYIEWIKYLKAHPPLSRDIIGHQRWNKFFKLDSQVELLNQ